ncbi:hypothetical protein HMPREF9103_02246 [Lentilactobacillus parafarraginis F0439]|uniref:Uncharacterized protein n=1 Tax=Lentilactobacillus parafarraginis F0439 TaxID=797515 RepID=G9ZR85_9LACO|nr:hypothetical protein HMPREF9103_02246 [Lentilactobacillus parafarraginis F0439]
MTLYINLSCNPAKVKQSDYLFGSGAICMGLGRIHIKIDGG